MFPGLSIFCYRITGQEGLDMDDRSVRFLHNVIMGSIVGKNNNATSTFVVRRCVVYAVDFDDKKKETLARLTWYARDPRKEIIFFRLRIKFESTHDKINVTTENVKNETT
ncbi:hypothetical protein ACJX0J_038093 [Zea mays]